MNDASVSLRDYVDEKCGSLQAEMDRRMTTVDKLRDLSSANLTVRFEAIDKSTMLASQSIDKRLEGMNEFREQLNRQAATFLTRSEADDKIQAATFARDALERRIQELERTRLNVSVHDTLETRVQNVERIAANAEGRLWAMGVGLTILTLIVSVGLHFIH